MAFDAHDFFVRFIRALGEQDRATLEAMIHPDFVADVPQSGERSRGFEGFWAQVEQYPGGGEEDLTQTQSRLLQPEDRWAITPAYTIVPLASRTEFTVLMRAQYPDGRWWHIVVLVEMLDDRIYRTINYFAPEMPAPLAESIAAYQHG